MSTKKYLFEKVFEKAKNECGSSSKNALSTYLNTIFIDDYNCSIECLYNGPIDLGADENNVYKF